MRQRPHDVLLPDKLFEASGTVFAGENLIRHRRTGISNQAAFYPTVCPLPQQINGKNPVNESCLFDYVLSEIFNKAKQVEYPTGNIA
jgi:hypothetical protein